MTAGRPKGIKKGTIYYSKARDRWQCEYLIFDKNKNEEIKKTKSFNTKAEAEEFLTALQYQKNNELFIKYNGIPLGQLMRANVQRKLDMNLITETQYARVLKTIELIEKNNICSKKIEDISSDDIQNYLNTLTHYSNSYIKKIVEQFTQSYNLAMNKGYISKNPMIDVIKPRSSKADKVVRAMTVEEEQSFFRYLQDKTIEEEPYKNVFLIQMFMGLRVGEALALRSGDVNLIKNVINVNKTITTDKNGKAIMGNTTKTYAGIREVPIPSYMRDSLIQQLAIAENNKDHQLFLSPNGRYVDGRNVNYILKKRLAEIGIEGLSTHSLRHTFGTRCVESGMRAVAVKDLMGHSDISVTLNTYTSVFDRYKESELEKVNDYYIHHMILEPNRLLEESNRLIEQVCDKEEILDEEEHEIE